MALQGAGDDNDALHLDNQYCLEGIGRRPDAPGPVHVAGRTLYIDSSEPIAPFEK